MNFADIVIFPSKGAVLLPVILYIDGTWLSKGGGAQRHPYVMHNWELTSSCHEQIFSQEGKCCYCFPEIFNEI